MKQLIPCFLLLVFAGCKSRELYRSADGRCELVLYKDSTYYSRFPTFLGTARGKGTYEIKNNLLVLKYADAPFSDSIIDCSSSYFPDNPDTVAFSFRDSKDSAIEASFAINHNPAIFKTDNSGHLKLSYNYLIAEKIIPEDRQFHSLTILYGGIKFEQNKPALPSPSAIDIKLNEDAGKKMVTYYANYAMSRDTIFLNHVDPKVIRDRKLVKVK
jgi:hypothetical protein